MQAHRCRVIEGDIFINGYNIVEPAVFQHQKGRHDFCNTRRVGLVKYLLRSDHLICRIVDEQRFFHSGILLCIGILPGYNAYIGSFRLPVIPQSLRPKLILILLQMFFISDGKLRQCIRRAAPGQRNEQYCRQTYT